MFFYQGHTALTRPTRCRTVVTRRTVVQMSRSGKSGLQYSDDLFPQLWGVRRGRLPYDPPINREVRMDRDIAKADDVASWRLGKTSAQEHRTAGRRLTDDRQLVQHGAAHEIIVRKPSVSTSEIKAVIASVASTISTRYSRSLRVQNLACRSIGSRSRGLSPFCGTSSTLRWNRSECAVRKR